MQFELSDDQQVLQRSVADLAARWDDDYWADADRRHAFPWEFYRGLAEGGWLGICVPEEYGGSDLGILEASLMLEAIAASGAVGLQRLPGTRGGRR